MKIHGDFKIEKGILIRCYSKSKRPVIPSGVTEIADSAFRLYFIE